MVHPNVQHNQVEPPKKCFTDFFLPTSPMYLGQRVKKFKHVSAEITVFGDDKSSALARPLLSTLQKKQNQLTSHEMKSDGWVPRNCPLLSRDPQTKPVPWRLAWLRSWSINFAYGAIQCLRRQNLVLIWPPTYLDVDNLYFKRRQKRALLEPPTYLLLST